MEAATNTRRLGFLGGIAAIGSASLLQVGVGLIRNKVTSVVLGPAGFGLFGIFVSVHAAASVLATLGLQVSVAREASLEKNAESLREVRSSALRISLAAGVIVASVLLALRSILARAFTPELGQISQLGLIGAGVIAAGLAAVHTGWLNGRGRLDLVAKARALGAVLGGALAVAAVVLWGVKGVAAAAAALAFGSWAASSYWSSRIRPAAREGNADRGRLTRSLLLAGLAVTVGSAATGIAQVALRGLVLEEYGLPGVAILQAAVSISSVAIGSLIIALSADFLPRLASEAHDELKFRRSVVLLLGRATALAAPVIVITAMLAEILIPILLSRELLEAGELLRWQAAGDLLRIPIWVLTIALLARGRFTLFAAHEIVSSGLFLFLASVWLPSLGLVKGLGAAYAGASAAYLASLIVFCFGGGMVEPARGGRQLALYILLPIAFGVSMVFPETRVVLWPLSLGGAGVAGTVTLVRLIRSPKSDPS